VLVAGVVNARRCRSTSTSVGIHMRPVFSLLQRHIAVSHFIIRQCRCRYSRVVVKRAAVLSDVIAMTSLFCVLHLLVTLMLMTSSSAGDDRDCFGESVRLLCGRLSVTCLLPLCRGVSHASCGRKHQYRRRHFHV